jgi:hypothetical protein
VAAPIPADLPVQWLRFADVKDEIHVAGNGEQPDDLVLVLPGGARLPGSLELDYHADSLGGGAEGPAVGILVRGDLTIDGSLLNWEDDYGPFLEVHGDLTVRGIATGGSQIHIGGSLTTEELVGVYNHGRIAIDGDLNARIIATEHTVAARGRTTGHRYEGHGQMIYAVHGDAVDGDNPYECKGVFASGVLGVENHADLDRARRWVASGRTICRPAFTSVREEFRARIGSRLDRSESVRSLTFIYKDLTVVPDEIFAFRNLRTLDLTGNRLRTLPERLGGLTELRELRLRGNGLHALPESVGNLTKLRHLDLEANCLVGLPDSLARCAALNTVNLVNNPYSYVRLSFGSWRDVELMWSLPDCLFELPELEHLTFSQTLIKTLPARPFSSPLLARTHVRSTLLTEHDPALHPQLDIDTDSSRGHAENYIEYWFNSETVRLSRFFDQRTGGYDFTEYTALLELLLRILIPAAAPYDRALKAFDRRAAGIAKGIHRDHGDQTTIARKAEPFTGTEHVRRLFTAFAESLEPWEQAAAHNPLIIGLREIFRGHA